MSFTFKFKNLLENDIDRSNLFCVGGSATEGEPLVAAPTTRQTYVSTCSRSTH